MAVSVSNATGDRIDQYWEDGPQFTGWGETISSYPDGTAATVQGNYGNGWIILTGIHAVAPANWRKPLHLLRPFARVTST